jgi:hypothetical protein
MDLSSDPALPGCQRPESWASMACSASIDEADDVVEALSGLQVGEHEGQRSLRILRASRSITSSEAPT